MGSCSARQLWRANSYAERRINYELDSLDPSRRIVNDSCWIAPPYLIENAQRLDYNNL